LSSKHFDFDLNYTLRNRPSRNLSGLNIKEYVVFATISTNNGLFFGN